MVTLLATETAAVRRVYSNGIASSFVGETTWAVETKKRTLAFVQAASLTSRHTCDDYVQRMCVLSRVHCVDETAGRRIRWELTI